MLPRQAQQSKCATIYPTTQPGETRSNSDKYKETGGVFTFKCGRIQMQAEEAAAEG